MTRLGTLPPPCARTLRYGTPASAARRAGALLVLFILASATLAGCGMRVIGQRTNPSAHRSQPQLTELQAKLHEAREQSALDAQEPYWPYRLGQIYLGADSSARAEAALKASLERDRSYAPALSLLSRIYYDTGRHREAVEMLESARARAAGSPGGVPPGLLAGLALHYDALGRPDLAAAVAAEVPRSHPEGSRSAMVYLTLRGERPEAAADLAVTALGDDPGSAANQNNYGITRLRAGDTKSARRAFQMAIELDPKLPGPYYNLAILEKYYLLDDQAAARWLTEYRKRASEDPDSLFGALRRGGSRNLAGKGH